MQLLNGELNPFYSDHPDESLPWFLDELRELDASGCFVPRYYQAPNDAREAIPASGYQQYSLTIPAGSFIWGLLRGQNSAAFTVQITDVALKHRFFSQPAPDGMFIRPVYLTVTQALPPECYVLPKPYSVIAPGIFLVEIWGAAAANALMVVLTAEVGTPWKGQEGVRI